MNVELIVVVVIAWVIIDIISRVGIASMRNIVKREKYLDYFMVANIAGLVVLFFYLYMTYMAVSATNV